MLKEVGRRIYRGITRPLIESWVGTFHAGALVKGLYLQWTLSDLLKRPAGHALDAGCGAPACFTTLLGRRHPNWRFVGVDWKLDRSLSRPDNVLVCIGDVGSLPVRKQFQIVFCVDVLEHVAAPERVIKELSRCLCQGGYLFIHVPAQDERWIFPNVDREYAWMGPPKPGDTHLWEGFTIEQLSSWLKEAGMDMITSRYTFGIGVQVLRELFMLAEARRIRGIGLCLFPLIMVATWLEWRWGLRRGNGVLVLGQLQKG